MFASLAVLILGVPLWLQSAAAVPHALTASVGQPTTELSDKSGAAFELVTNDAAIAIAEPRSLSANASGAIVPAPSPVTAARSEQRQPAWQRRVWVGLTLTQHTAAAFDAWSTRRSIGSGNGHELNPLMRTFANSNAIYPALQVMPLGFDFLSRRMMKSSNPVVRKFWWLPQTASTIGFVWSGVNNLGVASGR